MSRGGFRTCKEAERAVLGGGPERSSPWHVRRAVETDAESLLGLGAVSGDLCQRAADNVGALQPLIPQLRPPSLGRTLLPNVTPARLNAFYVDLLESGRCNGDALTPGLSPKTVKHVHTKRHKALEDAFRLGHLPLNPVSLGHHRSRGRWRRSLDARAATRVRPSRSFRSIVAAWLLIVTTGMAARGGSRPLVGPRRSVVWLGIRCPQSDRRAVLPRPVSEPKTAKGRRSIALDRATVEALKAHRVRQQEEQLAAGALWQNSGLVFSRDDGSPIHPQRFTSWFRLLGRERGFAQDPAARSATQLCDRSAERGHTREGRERAFGARGIATPSTPTRT